MNETANESLRALRRLLANGPLTALPKRPADQALIARLATAQFAPGRGYAEAEVNETLADWLATFSAPYGIDHVTMRRLVVDLRLLRRDKAGATYRVAEDLAPAPEVEPAEVLAAIAGERRSRKEVRAA